MPKASKYTNTHLVSSSYEYLVVGILCYPFEFSCVSTMGGCTCTARTSKNIIIDTCSVALFIGIHYCMMIHEHAQDSQRGTRCYTCFTCLQYNVYDYTIFIGLETLDPQLLCCEDTFGTMIVTIL